MTLTGEQARSSLGHHLLDTHRKPVGVVDGIYFDDDTGDLTWVAFSTPVLIWRDAFVPAEFVTPDGKELQAPVDPAMLLEMPRIKPRDGMLSGAQVARLHDFFGTFTGTHLTGAHEGAPVRPGPPPGPDPHTLFRGRIHETAFGTGTPGPNEPHDVTLLGTGNSAP